MTLVESLKCLEGLIEELDSKFRILERTHTKEKGDLIIEERLRVRDALEKRIEARMSEMKKTLEEMKKK